MHFTTHSHSERLTISMLYTFIILFSQCTDAFLFHNNSRKQIKTICYYTVLILLSTQKSSHASVFSHILATRYFMEFGVFSPQGRGISEFVTRGAGEALSVRELNGCQKLLSIWARLPPNLTNQRLLRSVFCSFWRGAPKWTENWS